MQSKIIRLILVLHVILAGCNEEALDLRSERTMGADAKSDGNNNSKGTVGPKNRSKHGQSGGNNIEEEGSHVRIITDAGFSLSLASATQLGRRIDQCLGDTHRFIKSAQIIGAQGSDDTAFLLGTVYTSGDDLIAKLKPLIDGNEAEQRAGVRQSAVSIRYFSNLQEIARIVADSCDRTVRENSDPEAVARCSCVREDNARAMFDRCLNAFSQSDEDIEELLGAFRTQCSTSPKKAIASMIASFAFAVQH